jgi:hypothetical protein
MPPLNPPAETPPPAYLKELIEFQSSMYDKASTYTKIIIGLGYGGFFTAWSGSKQHLSPKILVASALFETVSLILFVVFEVWGAMVTSHIVISFSEAVHKPVPDIAGALQSNRNELIKLNRLNAKMWRIVFPATTLTGLLGGMILIYGFVAGLWRML